jgi:hypothetical protein
MRALSAQNRLATTVPDRRYIIFQMAEIAIARQMFQEILRAHRRATAAATARASTKRLIVTRSSAIDRMNASRCQ